jgi:hypothetical protein
MQLEVRVEEPAGVAPNELRQQGHVTQATFRREPPRRRAGPAPRPPRRWVPWCIHARPGTTQVPSPAPRTPATRNRPCRIRRQKLAPPRPQGRAATTGRQWDHRRQRDLRAARDDTGRPEPRPADRILTRRRRPPRSARPVALSSGDEDGC